MKTDFTMGQPRSGNVLIKPNMILFLLATDFYRFFWVLTPLDIVSILYLSEKLLRSQLPRTVTLLATGHFFVFFLIVLVSGILNSFYVYEHIVLIFGTLLAVTKAVAIIDAFQTHGDDAWRPLTLGFLSLNILLSFALLAGIGFSGSGRFSGFFTQTNGMAAFQTFASATALFAFLQRKSGVVLLTLLLSFALLFLTGSRGSIVSALIITAMVIFKFLRNASPISMLFLYPMVSLPLIFYVSASDSPVILDLSVLLSNSEFYGVRRIGTFLASLHYGEIGEVYAQSRGNLNEAAMDQFLQNPTFFGNGYESSLNLLGLGNRVHNIFLSSALELGALGLLFFSVAFISGCLMTLTKFSNKGIAFFFVLMFIATWLQAIKTPYYFLNGISWAVMIFSFGAITRQFSVKSKVQAKHA